MTARCHNDTCSIEWNQVNSPSPAYEASVIVDDLSAIECVEGEGLDVKLAAAACNDILSQDGSGALQALLPSAQIVPFSDAARTSVAATDSTDTDDYAVTPLHAWENDTGCEALVIVRGQYRLQYAILGTGSAVTSPGNVIRTGALTTDGTGVGDATVLVPFNAQWHAALLYGVDASPTNAAAVNNFATSGIMATFEGSDEYQYQVERRGFTHAIEVPAGSTLNIASRWAQQGTDQNVNVIAYGSGVYADLGAYLADADFVVIPLQVD